jgi:hypothetical protein
MRKLFVTAASAAFALGFATIAAADERMAGAFDNTITVTNDQGTVHYHFNPDNTFHAQPEGGDAFSGSWHVQGDDICVNWGEGDVCSPLQDNVDVGDTWQATNTLGQTYTATVTAGR